MSPSIISHFDTNFLTYQQDLKYIGICSCLDKKNSRRQNACQICVACFCPCLILGHITSIISREDILPIIPNNCRFKLGFKGIVTCCFSFGMTIFLWPISPLLSTFTFLQRRNLNIIYSDNREKSIQSKC